MKKQTEISQTRDSSGIQENRNNKKISDSTVPIRSEESELFIARLTEIIGEDSKRSFAGRCHLSDGLLGAYLKGEKLPGFKHLVSLADAGGVLVDWLATGRMPKTRAEQRRLMERVAQPVAGYGSMLDPSRLRLALTMAEDAAALIQEPLTPDRRADLTLAFYQRLSGEPHEHKR